MEYVNPAAVLPINGAHFVFVKGFLKTTTPEDLLNHFDEHGPIMYIYIPRRNRYGFVYFTSEESVTAALHLNGSVFGEEHIIVRRGVPGGPNANHN